LDHRNSALSHQRGPDLFSLPQTDLRGRGSIDLPLATMDSSSILTTVTGSLGLADRVSSELDNRVRACPKVREERAELADVAKEVTRAKVSLQTLGRFLVNSGAPSSVPLLVDDIATLVSGLFHILSELDYLLSELCNGYKPFADAIQRIGSRLRLEKNLNQLEWLCGRTVDFKELSALYQADFDPAVGPAGDPHTQANKTGAPPTIPDSGYGSASKAATLTFDQKTADHDTYFSDNASIITDNLSLDLPRGTGDAYVDAFVEHILEATKLLSVDEVFRSQLIEMLPDLLRSFALRVAFAEKVAEGRAVGVFTRQNRE